MYNMGNKVVHTIRSQTFNVVTDHGKEALSLQSRLSFLNQREIPVLLNRVLDAFEIEDKSAQFENIELDLGIINPNNFDREILNKLESALQQYLLLAFRNNNGNKGLTILSAITSKSDYVIFYLTKGYYNWSERPSGHPRDWLKELLQEKNESFKTELLAIAKNEEVRLRLIFQFEDELLDLLVEFIYPQRAGFIIEFKNDVISRHEKKPILQVSPIKMRNVVWEVILEYLFVNSGSYHTKKTILKYLINQLAIKHGLRVDVFLGFLKSSIKELALTGIHQFELGAIFSELMQELKPFNVIENNNQQEYNSIKTSENLLNYYFRHSSLPYRSAGDVEEEILHFIKKEPLRARAYFRTLIINLSFDIKSLIAQFSEVVLKEIIDISNIPEILELETFFQKIFIKNNVWKGVANSYISDLESKRNRLILHAYVMFLRLKQTPVTCLIVSVQELLNIPDRLMFQVLDNLMSDPRYKSDQQLKNLLFSLSESQAVLNRSTLNEITSQVTPEFDINIHHEYFEQLQNIADFYKEIRLLIIDAGTYFLEINRFAEAMYLITKGCFRISSLYKVPFMDAITYAENAARSLFPELAVEIQVIFNNISNNKSDNLSKSLTEISDDSKALSEYNRKNTNLEIENKNDLIHELTSFIFQLKRFIIGMSGQDEIFWKISELANTIAKKYNISVFSVIEQCSRLSVSEVAYEITVKEYLKRYTFALQDKSVEYSKNLILFYLNNETLPFWASSLSFKELQHHAKIFIRSFSMELSGILKNNHSKVKLIKLLDTDGFNTLLFIVNPSLPGKLVKFHSKLEDILFESLGYIRNDYFHQIKKIRTLIVNRLFIENNFKDEKFFKYYWEVLLSSLKIEPEKLIYLLSNSRAEEYFNKNSVRSVFRKYIFLDVNNNKDVPYSGFSVNPDIKKDKTSFIKMLDGLKIAGEVEQKQIVNSLISIYADKKSDFYYKLLNPVVRSTITHNCSLENLKDFIFSITPEKNKSGLHDAIKLLDYFKQYLSSTQYDKIARSYYNIYLLKLGDDYSNKWSIKAWTGLVFQNMTLILRREEMEKLVTRLVFLVNNDQLGSNIKHIVNNLNHKIQQTSLQTTKKMFKSDIDITNNTVLDIENDESVFVCNAGIVIISPFIPRLFDMMGLLENGVFKNEESRIKAIYALYFAVTGKTEAEENELVINKIICGVGVNVPVYKFMEFNDDEKSLVESLLTAVIQQWSILKKTSIAGLRETFLQREGKLEIKELEFKLTVKQSGVDVLLDQIPWGIHTLKLSWMEKIINVEWR